MAEIVAIGFHRAERDAAQPMDFQDVLLAGWRCDDEDV